jgi:hypothetical protein
MMERFMRKLTVASIASVCMVPMLFASQDASAIPSFARKYGTSCYTCHSGFPNRNAFGEAFKNNGYRWPGGEDEDKSKQEQLKMGADGWKKTFPESPWPAEIPGYAPIAIWVRGNLVDYSDAVKTPAGANITNQKFQWGNGIFNNATIFFGGTMGDNLSAFVQYSPLAPTATAQSTTTVSTNTTGQLVWNFKPGLKLGFGNGFSDLSFGNQTNIGSVSSLVPTFGTGAELVYIPKDYFKLTAGIAQGGVATANSMADSKYVRGKYKIGGAGLLSGAGGTYGNEFVGLDNNITFGATAFQAAPGTATGSFAIGSRTERFVYEADVTGNYGSFMGSFGVSRSTTLSKNNLRGDVGYFFYPWLKGTASYISMQDALQPSVAFALATHLRANASLTATYSHSTREFNTARTQTNPNTFTLAGAFAF